jgi:ubiquinone/menaquinone biosynthesis C-methylase UbiE
LKYLIEKNSDGTMSEFLVGVQTNQRFPFKKGIPVLYDVARLEGYNLKYNLFYHKLARFYDFAMRLLAWLYGSPESGFRSQFLQLLEINQESKILEVSVGTGTNLSLLPGYTRCYGLDLSWPMLAQCQKNLKRWDRKAELFYGNAELLPFKEAMFDVVFHVGGINAFSDRAKAITEMIRVARSGTQIVIVDETSKLMQALKWMPSARKMLAEWGERCEPPVNLVPADMREVKVNTIVNEYFYVLSLRKP